jgi:very-long-chain enoyl-CoA reductase
MEIKIDNKITKDTKDSYKTLIISSNDTLLEVKSKIKNSLGISVELNRIGIIYETEKDNKKNKTLLSSNNKKISDYGIKEGALLVIKDLGFQINRRTVYILEYLGPILISMLFFWNRGHFK